jgi:hypothetical protein
MYRAFFNVDLIVAEWMEAGVVIICCAVDDVIHCMTCSSELMLGSQELVL